jgi:hypothetical protein
MVPEEFSTAEIEAADALAAEIGNSGRRKPESEEHREPRFLDEAIREERRQRIEDSWAEESRQRKAEQQRQEADRTAAAIRKAQEIADADRKAKDKERAAQEALQLHQRQIGQIGSEWNRFKGDVRTTQKQTFINRLIESMGKHAVPDPNPGRRELMMRAYRQSWGMPPLPPAYDPAAEVEAELANLQERLGELEAKER